ncbi:transcriptional regulator [Ventosimonas gracilis]|uniref:Transcriptional regulator n=1 Tax=Ventosimonas gracilis TaxID=1680762 RepID=A0A139SUM2_9GAMM|nr:AlpA family transcriptional regulator [Ventosimonas gracilis]KXU38265.1 transcriptional regulator [Ventosimonas gracilis]
MSNPEQIQEHPPVEHRILRFDEVQAKTGFKRAHLYNLMQKGELPRTVRLGVRAVGWNSVEVEQWVLERLARQV